MAPKPTTAITKKTTTSKGSDSVRALQTSLNAKGANLKVDGISGPLTKAAQAKFGGSTTTTKTGSGTTSTNKVGGDTISAKPKTSIFANPFAKGSGNFFSNVLGGAKMVGGGIKKTFNDAINTVGGNSQTGSAMVFDVGPTYTDPATGATKSIGGLLAPAEPIPDNSYGATAARVAAIEKDLGLNIPPAPAPTSFSGDASGSLALSAGQFTNNAPSPTDPTGGGLRAGLEPVSSGGTTNKTAANTTTADTSAFSATGADAGSSMVGLGVSPDTLNGLNKLNMDINDTTMSNNPFLSKESKGEFQNNTIINYAENAAKLWNSPEQATAFYNTPQGQEMVKDYVAKGGKVTDIIAKIKPLQTNVNGLQPAQTTAEYLQGGQAALRDERNVMNEMIANELNYTQQQKDILFGKKDPAGNDIQLGIAAQQKKENEERIAYYDRLEARFDKNEKEKTRNAIDKARAEFEMKDAEVEIARINAKNNLTEFLAKIGALRTDGNALLGIEKLEQSYQAQRQQLRQNFLFAEREIRQASEERMFNLETDLEDKKFKLSQDLSKTEREVLMDSMKLDYDFNKTISNLKLKWSDSIKTEREKAAAKAEALKGDWTNSYLTTMGADMFKSLPAEFRNTWLSNNPIDPRGYKTTQEDLAKTFMDWQQKQGTIIPLTDTQYSKAMAYIQTNSDNFDEDVNAFNTDNAFRSQILGKIQ